MTGRASVLSWWFAWLAAFVSAAAVVDALGQPVQGPGAGSVARSGTEPAHSGHGWVLTPESRGQGWLVMHLPPRARVGAGGRLHGSEWGTAREAYRLESLPEAVAAVGDELYLAFRSSRSEKGGSLRQVFALTAMAVGPGDLWVYSPDRRLRAQPALPGVGTLLGFVGTPAGPAALIDRSPRDIGAAVVTDPVAGTEGGRIAERSAPDLVLLVLHGGSWRTVELPAGVPGGGSPRGVDGLGGEPGGDRAFRRFMLASSDEGLAVIATRPARHATIWTARLSPEIVRRPERDRRREAEELERRRVLDRGVRGDGAEPPEAEPPLGPVRPDWQAQSLLLPTLGERSVLPTGPLAMVGSRLIFGAIEGAGTLGLYAVGAGEPERLAGVALEVPRPRSGRDDAAARAAAMVGVATTPGGRRVTLVLAPSAESGPRSASPSADALSLRVVEVSLDTGSVLYDGPSTTGSPLNRDEIQAVLLVVLGVTTILLVWTVRGPGREQAVHMPPGSALAEPGRRLVAAIIDIACASVLAGWALGLPLSQAITLAMIFGEDANLPGLGVFLMFGVGVGAAGDGLLGRSPGKAIMGLRVVAVVGPRSGTWRAPGLGRGLIRNVFRWVLAPLAVIGLGRPDGRHRGDVMTGTAVVVRVEPPPEGGEDAEVRA